MLLYKFSLLYNILSLIKSSKELTFIYTQRDSLIYFRNFLSIFLFKLYRVSCFQYTQNQEFSIDRNYRAARNLKLFHGMLHRRAFGICIAFSVKAIHK